MAKVVSGSKEVNVKDGESIISACEDIGVPFGCYVGDCGACRIQITEGAENLSEMTDKEKEAGLAANERLACQCRINKGNVKIKF